jgi:hypothetical protein
MGLVLLDLLFRIEKGFKIQLAKGWWVDRLGLAWGPGEFRDISLQDLHAEILEECVRQGVKPPANSWPLLVSFVGDAAGFKPPEVLPETMLLRDVTPNG